MTLRKNTILSIFLLLSLVLSIWVTRISVESAENSKGEDTKDAFMTEVHYISYNKEGQWESSFYTPHIDQYDRKGITLLQHPTLHAVGEENLTWKMTAKRAISYRRTETVALKDDVVIERINHKNNETTRMETTEMTLHPQERYLKTKAPVTIKQPNGTIEAIGLTADLKTGDIQLPSNTKGTYIIDK